VRERERERDGVGSKKIVSKAKGYVVVVEYETRVIKSVGWDVWDRINLGALLRKLGVRGRGGGVFERFI
jgi:hypothetical protein